MALFRKRDQCKVCKQQMVFKILDTVGRDKGVEAEFIGFPVLECPVGHMRRTLHADQGFDTVSEMYPGRGFDHLERLSSEPFVDTPECGDCGGPLTPTGRMVDITIDVPEKPGTRDGFSLVVRLPQQSCSRCGNTFVVFNRQIASDVSDAMVAAYESAAIKP